jgi:hypothetical protein
MTPFLLSIVILTAPVGPLQADAPFRFPEAKHGNSELKYRNGLPVLTVAGTPEQMGEAIGVLALRPARRITVYPEDLLHRFHLGFMFWPAVKLGDGMVDRFPADYRTEFETMVRGGEVVRDKLVVANTLFDLKKIVACSALLVEPQRSSTGGTLMGRNLDYPPLGYLQDYTLVTVYRPRGVKHAFATIGFPGLVGCLSGMNDAGLAVAVLEVPQAKLSERAFDIKGMPYGLCFRRLLEECTTIEEAHTALSRMRRTALGNLAVADRKGVALFEISPDRVVLRRGPNGTTVATNHFLSDELRCRTAFNFCRTFDRYKTLEKASQSPRPITPAHLHAAMHAAHEPDTMQSMIFEPSTLRLRLAVGLIPASAGEMRVLDLGPLFRANGE